MYLTLARQRLQKIWNSVAGGDGQGSGVFPVLAVVVVVAIPGGIYLAHRHAKFHSLEQKIEGVPQEEAGPRPGGREPMMLKRSANAGSGTPEFASVTLLPGLGMDVLQITASLPGRGEVPLLAAPTTLQLADGTFQPGGGVNDLHGALEVPWSGNLGGQPSPVGTSQNEVWGGRTIAVPSDPAGQSGLVEGGLLRSRDADTIETAPAANASRGTATYSGTDFDDHWFSKTETKVSATLDASTLTLTVQARNVGDQPEPLGIGWHPRFLVVGGHRGEVMLKLPASERLEYADKIRHVPTGKMLAAGANLSAFIGHASALGDEGFDEALTGFKETGDAPIMAELRDPAGRYGLRVTGVSKSIKEMRVYAPADQGYVSLGFQTNLDDALAPSWSGDAGVVTLRPGETLEWEVKLQIFALSSR